MFRAGGHRRLNWPGSMASAGASRPLFLRSPRLCPARSIPWVTPRRRCLPFAWRCWLITPCRSSNKAALRSGHGRQKINDEVSGYYLSLEIGRTYDGMMIAIPTPHWAYFHELSDKAFAEALRELAASVN